MHIARLFFLSLVAEALLSAGSQVFAQEQLAQGRNPSLYPQPEPSLEIRDPHFSPWETIPSPRETMRPYPGSCQPAPTYEMTALGLRPNASQCADRPGEGVLDALHPDSLIEPMMIIEVGPGTTIIIPRRHYYPGMGRVIHSY